MGKRMGSAARSVPGIVAIALGLAAPAAAAAAEGQGLTGRGWGTARTGDALEYRIVHAKEGGASESSRLRLEVVAVGPGDVSVLATLEGDAGRRRVLVRVPRAEKAKFVARGRREDSVEAAGQRMTCLVSVRDGQTWCRAAEGPLYLSNGLVRYTSESAGGAHEPGDDPPASTRTTHTLILLHDGEPGDDPELPESAPKLPEELRFGADGELLVGGPDRPDRSLVGAVLAWVRAR